MDALQQTLSALSLKSEAISLDPCDEVLLFTFEVAATYAMLVTANQTEEATQLRQVLQDKSLSLSWNQPAIFIYSSGSQLFLFNGTAQELFDSSSSSHRMEEEEIMEQGDVVSAFTDFSFPDNPLLNSSVS